jgi:Flp pilus assembly protein TadD
VVRYSFALNYAWTALKPWSYHVVNLAIHLLAGLTLFGLARQTLLLPSMSRFHASATGLAFAIALLWMVHPLNTQAVSYVVQRYESLMGFFYLLTMYCSLRAMTAARPLGWTVASVECGVLALASKEVAISLPIMVLLYDRAFVAGSFRAAWRARRGLYCGLFGLLLVFIPYYKAYSGGEGQWAGHGIIVPWYMYAASEPGVILHYLRLAFWPTGQCVDYSWPVAHTVATIAPQMAVIGALVAATVWWTITRPKLGFLGAWFFLILAPTSSVMPIMDLAFEHRMYLPLAAIVVATILAADALMRRWGPSAYNARLRLGLSAALTVGAGLALGVATHERNLAWRSELTIWEDNVAKTPNNSRAHNNLGVALLNSHPPQLTTAKTEFETAIRLAPLSNVDARANLGTALLQEHDFVTARKVLEKAVSMDGRSSTAQRALSVVLVHLGETALAEEHFRAALDIAPNDSKLHFNYAGLQMRLGHTQRAIEHMETALQLNPEYEMAHHALACVLAEQGDLDAAIEHWQTLLALNPLHAAAHLKLGQAFALQHRRRPAIEQLRECLRLEPGNRAAQQILRQLNASESQSDEAEGRSN